MDAAFLTDRDRKTLAKSVLCSTMSEDELSHVLATGTVSDFERSDYIFEQGDMSENLFLILDGWVQITRDESDGSHTLISTFHQGESLAEVAVFLGKPYPASAQAMTNVRALSINGSMLMDIMQDNRAVLSQSLASLYRKLHTLVDDVEWLKSRTLRERLAKFLLEHADGDDAYREVQLPFSKSLIAAKLGTSSQQLSRTFAELQQYGVRISGQTAIIEDQDALRDMLAKS